MSWMKVVIASVVLLMAGRRARQLVVFARGSIRVAEIMWSR